MTEQVPVKLLINRLTITFSRNPSAKIALLADALVFSADRSASTEGVYITAIARGTLIARHFHICPVVSICKM